MLRMVSKLLAPAVHTAPEVIVSRSVPHSELLFQTMKDHFISTFNISKISPQQKQQLLHEAIRDNDYALAVKFLDNSNIFSRDEYGDSVIIMALQAKSWKFLDFAKEYVTQKSSDTDAVLGVIAEEPNADTQSEMLGYAKVFFEID